MNGTCGICRGGGEGGGQAGGQEQEAGEGRHGEAAAGTAGRAGERLFMGRLSQSLAGLSLHCRLQKAELAASLCVSQVTHSTFLSVVTLYSSFEDTYGLRQSNLSFVYPSINGNYRI
jgi:hypothetical protein